MIGTDWLRRKAAARRTTLGAPSPADVARIAPLVEHALEEKATLATGGIVDPPTVATLFAQANDRPQHMATEYKRPVPTPPAPAFIVDINMRMPTEAEVEQIRQRFETALRPKPSRNEPLQCPCMAIYSECRCTGTNIRTQTNTRDFLADQQQ